MKGMTVGDEVDNVRLYDCGFTTDFQCYWETLNTIYVSKPVSTWFNWDAIMLSLLGMDFLQHYKWS